MSTALTRLIAEEGLPDGYRDIVESHWRPLSEEIAMEAIGTSSIRP